MWIVKLALRRPYTFVVAAMLLVLVSIGVLRRTPTDIFPSVDIPVISVVWTYSGLPASQMERQITQFSEYSLSGNVSGIQRIESQSFDGLSVIRAYLHEGQDIATATAQVTAISQTIVRRMPPGTQPPIIVRYNASSVPILQLAFSSDRMSEAEVYDYVNLRMRSALSVIRGARFPLPIGGRMRQVVVDLDPDAVRAHGLSANDVAAAIGQQNLTLPTGAAKIGEAELRVSVNSSPESIDALNDVPVRLPSGGSVRVRDVGFAHDGFAPQSTIARHDGRRAVVQSVMKTGDASTTEIAARVRDMLPGLMAEAPAGMKVELLADQSVFVTHALEGLLTEGLVAAGLTALLILLFLGSARSTLIVFVSIPLSVLATLLVMRAMGHTLNTMTLGGLALAVGVLVDDATVELENIHRNLGLGKPLVRAILDGAEQVAVPAFVASLSIGLVFASVVLLEGPAYYLFVPLGLAVGISVMVSWVLSRTLVPTLVRALLAGELAARGRPPPSSAWGRLARVPSEMLALAHGGVERAMHALAGVYSAVLSALLRRRALALLGFAGAVAGGAGLVRLVGRDFFPRVDAGQIRLHVTAPPGTRIEETERWFGRVERAIEELVPAKERESLLAQIGMPAGYTVAVTDTANVSSSDGELLVRLADGRTRSTEEWTLALRDELTKRFPELGFYFQPADIVTQVLSFGLPAPIAVQVAGSKRADTWAGALRVAKALRTVPGVVDVRVHQIPNAPRLHFEVDRQRAMLSGLTQRDVAAELLLAVGSNSQVAPSFWTDPVTGNAYSVSVQIPEERVDSVEALTTLSLRSPAGPQLLGDLASVERKTTPVFETHVDVQPTYEVRADVARLDLGSVAPHVEAIAAAEQKLLPPGSKVWVRGQVQSLRESFGGLGWGLLLAIVLVYGLMVVNFQSWLDPVVILACLPGAGVGVVGSLFLTGTTLSVPSLMGAVMSVGVGTANSTLLVSFANEVRATGAPATHAALAAGVTRLRPVLMTALAMIIGMLPMALGLGEGGEQNASLARAVIGGLVGATLATLLFVPVLYSLARARSLPRMGDDPELRDHP